MTEQRPIENDAGATWKPYAVIAGIVAASLTGAALIAALIANNEKKKKETCNEITSEMGMDSEVDTKTCDAIINIYNTEKNIRNKQNWSEAAAKNLGLDYHKMVQVMRRRIEKDDVKAKKSNRNAPVRRFVRRQ